MLAGPCTSTCSTMTVGSNIDKRLPIIAHVACDIALFLLLLCSLMSCGLCGDKRWGEMHHDKLLLDCTLPILTASILTYDLLYYLFV